MFKLFKKETPITLPLIDEKGNDNGSIIIWKKTICSVLYDHNKGHLAINLNQTDLNIGSRLLIAEESSPVLINGQIQKDHTGRGKTQPNGKWRNDVYISGTGGNTQVLLTDEKEIERFFIWLGLIEEYDILYAKREEMLERAEQFRKEAIRLRDQELKKAEDAISEKNNEMRIEKSLTEDPVY